MRHGLTAETIIVALEDAEDYRVFEATIIADYDAQSAMERELVLRLANPLWRLRRATTMETGLFASRVHWSVMTRCPERRPLAKCTVHFARCFRLSNLPNYALDRLSRYYEATLWRQVALT